MDDADPRKVLWANVLALMQARYGEENLTRFAREVGIGPGTASRIKGMETSVGLDVLMRISQEFKVPPWRLLVPGMTPPETEVHTKSRQLAEAILSAAQELARIETPAKH